VVLDMCHLFLVVTHRGTKVSILPIWGWCK
jgi:hypothetical protein